MSVFDGTLRYGAIQRPQTKALADKVGGARIDAHKGPISLTYAPTCGGRAAGVRVTGSPLPFRDSRRSSWFVVMHLAVDI